MTITAEKLIGATGGCVGGGATGAGIGARGAAKTSLLLLELRVTPYAPRTKETK
jgi:hypothetical protein